MSYILDALRRAEAERERGTVPGIHAQPAFAGAERAATGGRPRPGVALLLGGAVIVLLGVLAWTWFGGGASRQAAAPGPAPAASVAVAAAPAPAPVPAPSVLPAAPAPAQIAPAPPARASDAGVRVPARKAQPVPPAASAITAPRGATPVPARPAASAPANPVVALNALPAEIRSQLPPINVGGSMYSATPANRILIINGQVLHEGDRITPELVLEQIKLKAAVLAFKGFRYEISY